MVSAPMARSFKRGEFVRLRIVLSCSSGNLPLLVEMDSLPRGIMTNAAVLELNTLAAAQHLQKSTMFLAELILSSSVVLQHRMTVETVRMHMRHLEEAYEKKRKSKQYWPTLDEVSTVPRRLALHRICRRSRARGSSSRCWRTWSGPGRFGHTFAFLTTVRSL